MQDHDIADVVRNTQAYYDGPADEIYRHIWQDNMHMGTWQEEGDTLATAMARTNRVMAAHARLSAQSRVLDAGCGYGAAARFLAQAFGCRVVGINISEKELALARRRAQEAGLADRCEFGYGDFHAMPFADAEFDVVWSQEAFLHGADKMKILAQCHRVLRPGGRLVLSDLLVRRQISDTDRQQIYARLQTPSMWDEPDYRDAIEKAGLQLELAADWQANVAPTYRHVVAQIRAHQAELAPRVGSENLTATIRALDAWVAAAAAGKISQGFFVAVKPAA